MYIYIHTYIYIYVHQTSKNQQFAIPTYRQTHKSMVKRNQYMDVLNMSRPSPGGLLHSSWVCSKTSGSLSRILLSHLQHRIFVVEFGMVQAFPSLRTVLVLVRFEDCPIKMATEHPTLSSIFELKA